MMFALLKSRLNQVYRRRQPRLFERLEARQLLTSVVALPAENIELRSATLGAQVSESDATNPNLTIYWGDEDAGINSRDWDHSASVGAVPDGSYSVDATDLSVNTQYFYRAFAFSFNGGAAWSEVATFNTLPPQLATFESDPIRYVSGTSADLSGRVVDNGGDTPVVQVFYGAEDGGDTVERWQHQIDLGVVEGEFTHRLVGLTPNTNYFIRVGAENGGGRQWDTTTYEIHTADIPPLRISEFMAANSSTIPTRVRTDVEARFRDFGETNYDWIELQNATNQDLDLGGFHLTDDADQPTKWSFPEGTTISANQVMVVYASGLNVTDPALDENELLHTNFKLSRGGEFIAITDGTGNVLHSINDYPRQESDASFGYFGSQIGTLQTPSPGEPNEPMGAAVTDVRHVWQNDDPTQVWTVTAKVQPTLSSVRNVSLNYRLMFEDEIQVAMVDDGTASDQTAGDGIYTGVIPTGIAAPGQMLRYNVTATDELDLTGRAPLFANPESTPEYFGTMIANPTIASSFPVLHRFIEEPRRADSSRGTRASISYDGEFYDNVFIRIRGGTARNWPKKAYKIEFNDDYHFRFNDDVPRVDEININTTYTDKSYMRAVLTAGFQNDAGSPSPDSFLIRVQQNNEFFSLAIFVEQPDRDFLRRHGLDTEGSFYKAGPGSTYLSTAGFEKKTRETEDNSDLKSLIDGLKLSGDELERFLFDHVNLPAQINFMATNVITQNIDASDKNHFLYRDSNGSGEWHMLPWDLDLTFGPDALNTDLIIADQNTRGASNPNTVHPFLGGRQFPLHTGKINALLDAMIKNPRTQDMLLRRIRTMVDDFLATGYFEQRIDALVAKLDGEVELDRETWGTNAHFNRNLISVLEEANRIKDLYLAPRLVYLTDFHGNGGVGIPLSQDETASLSFGSVVFAAGESNVDYFTLKNLSNDAIDLSGWRFDGVISSEFAAGTVIPAGDELYLTNDVAAFRNQASGPGGSQGLFVHRFESDAALPHSGSLLLKRADGSIAAQTILAETNGRTGDFNSDDVVDEFDIQLLCAGIRSIDSDPVFDLNSDQRVDVRDLDHLVRNTLQTNYGDANLDQRFDSRDLVRVFESGEYDDQILGNSSWSDGDWNCDGEFNSSDLVVAFEDGGFVAAAQLGRTIEPTDSLGAAVDQRDRRTLPWPSGTTKTQPHISPSHWGN